MKRKANKKMGLSFTYKQKYTLDKKWMPKKKPGLSWM